MLHRVAGYAVDTGVLAANPAHRPAHRHGAGHRGRRPAGGRQSCPGASASRGVTYVSGRRRSDRERGWRLRAFFACLYYAGLRPGEAQQLRDTDAKLPAAGWGELVLSGSLTGVSGEHYNDGLR